jgi:hypothetical protein
MEWYMLGNKWYNGEGGYSETDPTKPALPHAQYEGWAQGADFSNGMNSYRGPDGKQYIYNNSQYMNGPKLFSYDGSPVPQAILDQVRAQVPDVQIGSDEMMRKYLLDPMGPGSAGLEGGSDLSNILKTLSVPFAGSSIASLLGAPGMTAMQTLTSALPNIPNPFSGAGTAIKEALPSWMQPTAGGVADTGFGAGTTPTLSANQLLENFAAQNPGNMGFTGDVGAAASGASTGITVPSWFGEVAGGALGAAGAGAAASAASAIGPGNGGVDDGALSKILNESGGDPGVLSSLAKALGMTPDSLLQTLGRAAPGLIGAFASSRQADDYKALADQFAGYGAPYRQRLADLYADPSKFLSSPDVQKPVQMGSDILARSLSTQGNPTGSGNALQQLQSYSADQLFGRLGQEKDRLGGFGGLTAYNSAAPSAASNAIGANANVANSLGAAANNVFNPPKTLAQQLQEFKTLSGVMG